MHTPTHNPHKPILLFTTTSIHTTIPKQRIGNYGVCGWKDRCRDGNLRTYCHVSPILFGWFFVEASPTCFCIFVKCFFCTNSLTILVAKDSGDAKYFHTDTCRYHYIKTLIYNLNHIKMLEKTLTTLEAACDINK